MSGICGIWTFDGGEPDLAPVLAQLERRGPDGTRDWRCGPVALGHTLLATTPEALVEQLPLTDPASGCTITADVRLDNREELIAALDLAGETRTIGDGELILRAYVRWGEECPKHLLGDFAFAIWDPRKERLFCARDHMGMRQLLYCNLPGKLFVFATEADALVAHADVPKRINEGRIADFLDDLEGFDFTSTFFDAVLRLPPATSMIIGAERCTLTRYWTLAPGSEIHFNSDQDYRDRFLAVFTEAVRCRLRSVGPLGSMLSGGMDSNAVAAIAGELLATNGEAPLLTFSAIGTDPNCAESQAIMVASQSEAFSPNYVRSDDSDNAAEEVERLLNDCSEPFDGSMVIISAVYRLARARGANVVLDGVAADVVLTAGNRVAGLLRQGRFTQSIREARGESRFWGSSWPFRTIFASALWAAFAPRWAREARRRTVWAYQDWLLDRGQSTVARDVAGRVDMRARRKLFRRHRGFDDVCGNAYRRRSVLHPHLVVARERYDRLAARFAVEPRDPFMDIRFVEFCLSLPAEQLQRDGWPKHILRRAMYLKIPDSIVNRPGKPHVGWPFTVTIMDLWPKPLTSLAADANIVPRLGNELRQRALRGVDREDWFKLVILSEWISRKQRR